MTPSERADLARPISGPGVQDEKRCPSVFHPVARCVTTWRLTLALAFALAVSSTGLALSAETTAQEAPTKRVLIISTGSRLGPGFILVDQQILRALRAITSLRIETYAENLDVTLFPAEQSRRIFIDYLAQKYADRPPDLVVLVFNGNLSAVTPALTAVFPATPIIVAGLTEEDLSAAEFGPTVSGFAQRADPQSAFSVMLQLQPDLQRIVVIGGTAGIDRQLLQRVEQAARFFDKRVSVDFWSDLTMAEVRRGISTLPPRTAVLYARFFRDGAGQQFISAEVGRWLGEWSSVPVYALSDASLGSGIVGGALASVEGIGRRAGELARLVLTGTPTRALPFEIRRDTINLFDGRALDRWRIDQTRLPADSIVRYRPESAWTHYRGYIAIAAAIIALQTALIIALIGQRRQRRRMQGALAQSQDLIEIATDVGDVGLWWRDVDTGALWANAPMRRLFGFTPDEPVRFEDFVARVHPEDRAGILNFIQRAQSDGSPYQGEYRIRLPDGSERWILAKGRGIGADHRSNSRRTGIVLDITQRKHAEQSLNEQRAFLRQVIDVNPNFIFAKDRKGCFTLVNEAVADAYGVSVEELLGKRDADFNANEQEVEHFRRMDLQVLDTLQERFIAEERITDANGKVRWLQTVKRPLVGADGSADQIVGASTDITRRKEAELALQEQRAELAHIERISIMGELVASLMHEINQPLTAILSNAQAGLNFLDQEPVNTNELREVLEDIVAANSRAAETMRGMRALAKKEAQLKFEAVDMKLVVTDVVRLLHGDAVMRDVRVSLALADDMPAVLGHRIQLQQVMLNLLLNAFDAVGQCPAEKRDLEVRAERYEGHFNRVSIRDSGHGLTDTALAKVFDRFYSTKREGLGLGLAICRSIVLAHGGSLWAENNPEGGATFHFTIPTATETAAPLREVRPRYVAA